MVLFFIIMFYLIFKICICIYLIKNKNEILIDNANTLLRGMSKALNVYIFSLKHFYVKEFPMVHGKGTNFKVIKSTCVLNHPCQNKNIARSSTFCWGTTFLCFLILTFCLTFCHQKHIFDIFFC